MGVSSILCFERTIEECFKFATDFINIEHLDIFCCPPHCDLNAGDRSWLCIKEKLIDFGVSSSIKAPSFVENLISINRDIRELTFNEYAECIKIASKIEADAVIIKAGMMFYPEKRFSVFLKKDFIEKMSKLLDYAKEHEVFLLLENYYYPYEILREPRDFEEMNKLFCYSDFFGFALNIPHLLESGFSVEFLSKKRTIADRIIQVYVGLRPSPWELHNNPKSEVEILTETKKLLKYVSPRFVVIATRSLNVLKKFAEKFGWSGFR